MDRRPNVLMFVTDQQRADHLGCAGDALLRTPHIDRIAAAGCRFDEFHVATPICQPNRASLMTCRLPSAHGVRMNGRELSHAETTFVELLREAGWATSLVGKAHLQNITDVPPFWPAPGEPRRAHDARRLHPGPYGQELWRRWEDEPSHELVLPYYGFEHVDLTIGHADEQHGHWRRWLRRQLPDADRLIGPEHAIPTPGLALAAHRQAWRTRVPEELYPTRWIADRTIERLAASAADGRPFFVQCSFPDPHHPYTPPGRWWEAYRPQDVALPASFGARGADAPAPLQALREAAAAGRARKGGYAAFACTEQEAREAIALNHGNLGCIDDAVGRVLQALVDLGLDDDTIVVYTADHGELMGEHGLLLKGGLHHRALTRVPCLWRDTAARRTARTTAALGQTIDLGITVLDRLGVEPAHGMQGRSLLDVIDGRADRVRDRLVVEEEGQRRDFGLPWRTRLRTLLDGRHRLTLHADAPWGELYDLHEDPHELHNRWADPSARALRDGLAHALAVEMMRGADESPYPLASA